MCEVFCGAGRVSSEMDERGPAALTEREAYFESLQLWMHRAQLQRGLAACFPYYMMSFAGPGGDSGSRPPSDRDGR